eukprot:15448106-Alexandrium_andersonii.AAC.1
MRLHTGRLHEHLHRADAGPGRRCGARPHQGDGNHEAKQQPSSGRRLLSCPGHAYDSTHREGPKRLQHALRAMAPGTKDSA